MSRLHIGEVEVAFERLGQAGPVIVFESGLGEDMRRWEQVARPLAACARVVLYDRPGIGHSGPRTDADALLVGTVVEQLAALLGAIDAPPPYILVGHSLGGFYMQAFARNRPREVAAVVLIDSASPFEQPGMFGSTDPPTPGSVMAVEEAGFAPSAATMLAGPPFPPVPLVVLAATDHGATPEREALWRDVQVQTAALSPRGRLQVVHGSGHFIQSDRPEVVIQALLQLMRETGADTAECRQASPQ
jgi:pimeloyl-ACP methyl ester carboxylesterase